MKNGIFFLHLLKYFTKQFRKPTSIEYLNHKPAVYLTFYRFPRAIGSPFHEKRIRHCLVRSGAALTLPSLKTGFKMARKQTSRDRELAALLEEVRALRRDIEAMKRIPAISKAISGKIDYEVLVKATPKRTAEYEVLVKAEPQFPAEYEVAVKPPARYPVDYEVLVKALPPDYQVLASPAYPPDYQVLVRSLPKLPPDYAVAVKPALEDQPDELSIRSKLPPDYQVLVKANVELPLDYEVLARAFPPDYAVLVKPSYPPDYEVAVSSLPALPPDYAVAVRAPHVGLDRTANIKSDEEVTE
jgi:hypothetical protein